MAKLEDIPKKDFFTVPDDYFDKLPAKIQSRIAKTKVRNERTFVFRYALRYALPVLVLAGVIFYYSSSKPDVETILASVDTEELIDYLQESGMTTEEMLENVEFSAEELEAIENEVYDVSLSDIENQFAN
jgi:hypothetical protein